MQKARIVLKYPSVISWSLRQLQGIVAEGNAADPVFREVKEPAGSKHAGTKCVT